MNSDKDPIVAKASASGQGGIGVVRISGSTDDLHQLCRGFFGDRELQPRFAHLLGIRAADQSLIDQAIVLRFEAPRSYTGEAVLEIQAHGGPAVQTLIVARALELGKSIGLRMASPGEFTQRAFLNGRLDLAQAEAVSDLIEAKSSSAARAAVRSLSGTFSKQVNSLNSRLVELRAYIEATLDFPEDEVDLMESGHVFDQIIELQADLQHLNQRAMRGKVLRDGLVVVLVGAPNVGKSSLMNALAGDDVAIVTDIAGTTRDKIELSIDLDGLVIRIIDTAGVRQTTDPIEKIGIEKTLQAVRTGDIVIHLVDGSVEQEAIELEAMKLIEPCLREGVVFTRIINKLDLIKEPVTGDSGTLYLSAKTGQGMEQLISLLKQVAGEGSDQEGDFMARTRHLECLSRAQDHLQTILTARESIPLDIMAEELRLASLSIGEIVGQVVSDDLLGLIFSRFCIGK